MELVIGIDSAVGWILNNPNIGWLFVLAYLMWEIRGKHGRIAVLIKEIDKLTVVIRGVARANERVDDDRVDEFLEGSEEPSDFLENGEETVLEDD